MALSLGLHGLAVLLLLAAGAAGSVSTSEQALLVELNLTAPASAEADDTAAEAAPEREIAIELAPPEEPPPLDVSDLKPIEPPKPRLPPPQPEQKRPAARPAAPKRAPSQDFGTASEAQQAAAGFLPAPAIAWEGKPRYRHPPTPAAYPPRAVELNQQGEVSGAGAARPRWLAVEVVLFRLAAAASTCSTGPPWAAVRGWDFLPAVRDGRPVAAWVEIPVRFDLR